MDKKNIDWANLGFSYVNTDQRFVANFKDGKWDSGQLTEDANVVINECAGVLQYAQTIFEGMKAYTTEDGLTKIEATFENDTVWLSIDQMAELFQRDRSVIGKHVRNIFKEGELNKESVWAKFAYTAVDGNRIKDVSI